MHVCLMIVSVPWVEMGETLIAHGLYLFLASSAARSVFITLAIGARRDAQLMP